jgi:putative glutamine amidotransferase
MRPVIGICSYLETMRWGAWEDRAAMVPAGYLGAVQRAGGLAVLLPPDPESTRDPDPVLDLLDGLILAGGVDVGPATYGASAHPATDAPNEERDAFELALARRALERDLPLLGICRGMQVLNVAAGGTLHQHLPDVVGSDVHRRTLGVFTDHEVRLEDGSLAARAAGETVHPSKSHHHQAVDVLGEGFVVTGWSAEDELPEAIEDPARRYALGVQWHPEADETSRLIASLVEEARAARR